MLRLLLLRHAQSTWNAQKRWQGRADPPLSLDGRRSAEAVASHFSDVGAIYTSPLLRARETAEIIGKVLGVENVVADEGLVERNLGEWTGLTRDQVQQGWPGFLDEHKWPATAEPTKSIRQRAQQSLISIADQVSPATGVTPLVLVVTHGGLITTIEQLLGQPWRPIVNLSGRELLLNSGLKPENNPDFETSFALGQILERPDELDSIFEGKDLSAPEVL